LAAPKGTTEEKERREWQCKKGTTRMLQGGPREERVKCFNK